MVNFYVPLIIRGEVIEDYEVEFEDRSGTGRRFLTPDVNKYIHQLVNKDPHSLADLYSISLEDIYDYLEELGARLDLETNPYWKEAFEVSCHASNLSRSVLEYTYRTAKNIFSKNYVRDVVESTIGSQYLEGWVPRQLSDGRTTHVRAMGTRSIHIIAGNVPFVAVGSLMRIAFTRNDAIIKTPSNDPLTSIAMARTMVEMAPNHPITKHFSAGYWKGGDEKLETKLYQSQNLSKIVAWGGYSSIKHISKYLGPGLDLITLDPKNSTTLIGKEVFQNEATMHEVAKRLACDMGGWDQEACVNARVMFIESGTDEKGIKQANRFGAILFDALQHLPDNISNGVIRFDPELKAEIEGIISLTDFYNVIMDAENFEKGAVIVSQMDEQVDFPKLLYGRVGNLVPLDVIDDALPSFTAATQTIGFYPNELRKRLRDTVALRGGQMLQPVGYAIAGTLAGPQDGIEPERRMCNWVVDNDCDPAIVPPPWLNPGESYQAEQD